MKAKVLTFVLGLVVGVAAAVFLPRLVAPFLPGLGPQMETVEGTVVRKQRDGERLLLTIDSSQGAALATFTQRVAEIDLLVEAGDGVTLALRGYQPFLADPEIRGVQKTGGSTAGTGPAPAVPVAGPVVEPAAEPAEMPAGDEPPAAELEEWPGGGTDPAGDPPPP